MPKRGCWFVMVTGYHRDIFHTTDCKTWAKFEGREHGFFDGVTLTQAVVEWVNGLTAEKIRPNKIVFCHDCNPQLED